MVTPEPQGSIAVKIVQEAYERGRLREKTQEQRRSNVKHHRKPIIIIAEHFLQIAVLEKSTEWEKDQESSAPVRQPLYQNTSQDMLIRYVKWLCLEGINRGFCYASIAIGCLLYAYSLEQVCDIAPDLIPEGNIRRIRNNLRNAFKERFGAEFPNLEPVASKEHDLILDALTIFTPWGQHYGSVVIAPEIDILATYFANDNETVMDWDRIALLINPAVGIVRLRHLYDTARRGEGMSQEVPPINAPPFSSKQKMSSPDHQERDRRHPPPFTSREENLIEGFLSQQNKRRKRFRKGVLRLVVNGEECECIAYEEAERGGMFRVPLKASCFEGVCV